jgi:uncharacterized OsmC-like protein
MRYALRMGDRIGTAFDRAARALTSEPSLGRGTGITRARIREGLTCDVEAGPWRFVADMPQSAGGSEAGPTPGVYGRAALASCLAIGYTMYAARLGVPIQSLEVEVEADYDDSALYGVSDSPPGYLEVRYIVTVESSAPEADVLRVLDEGDAHSPYLDVFGRAQSCRRIVRITGGA